MTNAFLRPEHLDEPITQFMRTEVTTLSADHTAEQALIALRGSGIGERIVYLYVVESDNTLVGVVPTRTLLLARPDRTIRQIMQPRVVAVPAHASVLVACELFVMHRFLAFPVVDTQNRLLGMVDVSLFTDEVFQLAEQRQIEDVFQLIGVHVVEAQRASPTRSFLARFPWLLANIIGGIGSAIIVGLFEWVLELRILLALFVPVVLALAESVSIQSMTITLATLHGRRVKLRRFALSLVRELATAAMLGAVSGLAVGGVAFIWHRDLLMGLAIAISIALSMITACLLGVILPSAVHAFRGDPKIAAGPITLATADLATLLFYFALAGSILS